MEYPLDRIVDQILEEARAAKNHRLVDFCGGLLRNMKVRQSKEKAETRDRYVAYRKVTFYVFRCWSVGLLLVFR